MFVTYSTYLYPKFHAVIFTFECNRSLFTLVVWWNYFKLSFFFRINQEICSKTLTQPFILKYIIYGITGGFYHSKYFKRWIKFAWTVLTFSSYFIVVIIGCGGYWLTTDNIPSAEISHLILMAVINTFVFVVIPAFTYRHRRELETILDFVDKEWKHKGMSCRLKSRIRAREKFILYLIVSNSFCSFVFILLHPFEILIYNRSKVSDVLDYVFPIPWLHQSDSTTLFLLIFIVHSVCMLVCLFVLICWNPFFINLAYQIYDAFSITCDRMHQFSTQAEQAFEKTYEQFSCCNDTFVFGNQGLTLAAEKKNIALQCEIELHRSRLLQNVLITAKEHQQLRR